MIVPDQIEYVVELIAKANLWLVAKDYPQLSEYEVERVMEYISAILNEVQSSEVTHDLITLKQISALHVTKTICEFRGIEVPEVVNGNQLKTPQDFKYSYLTKEFIHD